MNKKSRKPQPGKAVLDMIDAKKKSRKPQPGKALLEVIDAEKNQTKDLWPDDIKTIKVRPPVVALEEQGKILGKKTKNMVLGRARQLRLPDATQFHFIFQIEAPTLSYSFALLEIRYGASLYPVQVKPATDIARELGEREDSWISAESEEAFLEILSRIFKAQRTRTLIGALLAQIEHKITA
ncbi:MAG TPA: hypothetical protein VM186_05505 [Planctomycetota bacterium]|nr:hypothetical protein [Planctomycetota bacterium]